MKITAPTGLESSYEASTLSIGSVPLPPSRSANEHSHMPEHCVPKSQRASSQGKLGADDASKSPDQHLCSRQPSRPQSVPEPTVSCPIQETLPTHEHLTRSSPTNADRPIPEARRQSPSLFEIPTRNIISPAPEEIPVRKGPSPSSTSRCSNRTESHPEIDALPSPQPSPAPARAKEALKAQQGVKVKHLQPHELMSGERPKHIYGAFTSHNCPQGYRPPLKKTVRRIPLPECWHCPEAELSRQYQRYRSVMKPVRPVHPDQPNMPTTEPSSRDERDRGCSLPTPDASQEAVDERGSEPEPESGTTDTTNPSRVVRFLNKVASPFVKTYACVAGEIATYIHDRDARGGPLGSHDTETAQMLRRPTFE
ncbi:hypothetical protein GRF29_106g785614 [Pseudopithomyces chartarum]|uniref:Uncharacterized protein n=1 Tax=Pseudopithomyces chartarum TaxID=1892770 RepID=A0AAN6LX37_9PLEO|nr:hypothetical protein GRF29_106g785614 [Pseudopithomyces chartarum]